MKAAGDQKLSGKMLKLISGIVKYIDETDEKKQTAMKGNKVVK